MPAEEERGDRRNDPIWEEIRTEVAREAGREEALRRFLEATVLEQASLESSLSFHLAEKLGTEVAKRAPTR